MPSRLGTPSAGGYERVCFAAMLWGSKDQGRDVFEALMCGAHLQMYSDKGIRRIMYLCPGVFKYILPARLQKASQPRL